MTPERTIQTAILAAFATRPDLRLWRANTGAAMSPRGHLTRFGAKGQADLSGIIPIRGFGVSFWVEVKSHSGRQSEHQKNFQKMVEDFGGLYVLARSVEDVASALAAFYAKHGEVFAQNPKSGRVLGVAWNEG